LMQGRTVPSPWAVITPTSISDGSVATGRAAGGSSCGCSSRHVGESHVDESYNPLHWALARMIQYCLKGRGRVISIAEIS
jgi:hypothetical protein